MKRTTATGVVIQGKGLEWTLVRENNGNIDVAASKQQELEIEDAVLTDPEQLGTEIKRQCAELSGPVTLGLPYDQMLMRIVELPTTDPVEMNSMIGLQIDKFSPFPEDKIAVSYEVLANYEGGCRVLIVAVQKDVIEFMGTVFGTAGIKLHRIDADIMGWWRLISNHGDISDSNRHVILLLESGKGSWLIIQQGVPVLFNTASPGDDLSEEGYASEIVEELNSMILSLDVEHGAVPLNGLDIWHRNVDPENLVKCLQDEFNLKARVFSLDSLPLLSEGLARRLLNPPFVPSVGKLQGLRSVLDMVPLVWRQQEAASGVKRRLIIATGLILGVWVLSGSAFMAGFHVEKSRLKALENQMSLLREPTEEVRILQKRVKSFEQYLDRTHSGLECLREITRMLPEDVYLTSFKFRKGKNAFFRGEAISVEPIYDFKQALDKSSLFSRIDMGSTQPSKRKGATFQTFQMSCKMY